MSNVIDTTATTATTANGNQPEPEPEPQPGSDAVRVEAEGDETITLTWRDIPLTIPASADDLDIAVLAEMEANHSLGIVREILGETAFDTFVAEHVKRYGRRPRFKDLRGISNEIGRHYGFTGVPE